MYNWTQNVSANPNYTIDLTGTKPLYSCLTHDTTQASYAILIAESGYILGEELGCIKTIPATTIFTLEAH